MHLRRILKKERLAAGIRQDELAKLLGVHQSFISKYESGERLLTFVEIMSICRALKIEPESLLIQYLPHHEP